MGNQTTSDLAVSRPSQPGQWTLEGRTDYCQLVRNNFTHELAEQYSVPSPSGITLANNIQMYEHRRLHHTNTVRIYHIEREDSNYMCQGQDFFRVRVERIPVRLSEKIVNEVEGVRIVEGALLGYRGLFKHFGGFNVNDEMVGFNQKGQVKVWINSNFAINSIENTVNLGNKIISQGDMVNQIFFLVEEHLERKAFSNGFREAVLMKYPKSFNEALQLIQNYEKRSMSSVGQEQIVTSMIRANKNQKMVANQNHQIVTQQPQYFHQNPYQSQTAFVSQPNASLIATQHHSANSSIITIPNIPKTTNIPPNQSTLKHQPPQTIVQKHRPIQSPSQANIISFYQQPKLNIQQITNSKVQIYHQRNLNTERSFVLENNKAVQFDQRPPKINPYIQQQQGTRRQSLNNYKSNELGKNVQVRRGVNQSQKIRHNETKTFMSKSVSKQISPRPLLTQQSIVDTPHPIQSQSQSNFPISAFQIHSSNKVSQVSSKNVSNNDNIKSTTETKIHTVFKPIPIPTTSYTQKQQYKVFPKPSVALHRMAIQKVPKQSPNSSHFEVDMMNALNNISGIQSQNNKSISKISHDQIFLNEIQPQVEFPSTAAVDSVKPEVRRIMTPKGPPSFNSQSKTVHYQHLPSTHHSNGYQYEFQKTKIIPSNYRIQQHNTPERNITTPKFEYKTNSRDVSSNNLLSSEIQRLIQEHQADKQELLKKINEYQKVSRFNRATYDMPKIESKQSIGLKNSNTSSRNDFVPVDLYKQLDRQKY